MVSCSVFACKKFHTGSAFCPFAVASEHEATELLRRPRVAAGSMYKQSHMSWLCVDLVVDLRVC